MGRAASQRYRRTTATRRAGAGAAGRRGPDPRDPDQLKEREAKGRRIRRPPGVFVDSGAAADRHASWTTVMASTGGGGSHRAGGPEFGTGLTDHQQRIMPFCLNGKVWILDSTFIGRG